MISVFAGQEASGITDSKHGGKIYISTTARILFRSANPEYKNQKNDVLNKEIAKLFNSATIEEKGFTPKSDKNKIGEFRKLGSMRFGAILEQGAAKIIAVKGSVGRLAPPVKSSAQKRSLFEKFAFAHEEESVKQQLALDDGQFSALKNFLLPLCDHDKKKMFVGLKDPLNKKEIDMLIQKLMMKEQERHISVEDQQRGDFSVKTRVV
jgi:hypothetical protein